MSHEPHTPGPWRIGKHPSCVIGSRPGEPGRAIDGGRVPGDLEYYGGELVAESIQRRDVNLIAAAPDLLAACIAAADEDCGLSCFPQLVRAILKANGGKLPEQLSECRASLEIAGLDGDT